MKLWKNIRKNILAWGVGLLLVAVSFGLVGCGQSTGGTNQNDALTQYHITYELNGGINTVKNKKTYTQEDGTIELHMPSRVGYTFDGWYEDTAFTMPVAEIDASWAQDITLYAKWTAKEYIITYVLENGTNHEDNPEVYTADLGVVELQTPTRADDHFLGWYRDSGFKVPVSKLSLDTVGSDLTLYAKWEIGYHITYHLDGGENAAENPQIFGASSGTITLKKPTRLGYRFEGWFSDADFTTAVVQVTAQGQRDWDVYAKWVIITYSLIFHWNGGTALPDVVTRYTVELGTYSLPTELEKDGYVFAGWYTDATYMEAIHEITPENAAQYDLYAKWEEKRNTITYHWNGGNELTNVITSFVADDLRIILPTTSAKEGYTFAGWYTEEELLNQVTYIDPSTAVDYEVYAKWNAINYLIDYQLGGGVNDAANPATYKITDPTINFAEPTRTGFTFAGWFADRDYSASVIGIKTGSVGAVTIYAKWTPITYYVNYELNGGENHDNNPESFTANNPDFVLEDPSRTGYVFEGWYADSTLTDHKITTILHDAYQDYLVYAKWTMVAYAINYSGLGFGTVEADAPKTFTIESETIDLTNITASRRGYQFAGWYTDANFANRATQIVHGTTAEVTIYAKWNLATYTITYQLSDGTAFSPNDCPTSYTCENDDPQAAVSKIDLEGRQTKSGYQFIGFSQQGQEVSYENRLTQIDPTICQDLIIVAWFIKDESYFVLQDLGNGEAAITGVNATYLNKGMVGGTLSFPTTIGQYTIKEIGENAFNFASLTSEMVWYDAVTISHTAITAIAPRAFVNLYLGYFTVERSTGVTMSNYTESFVNCQYQIIANPDWIWN